MSASRWAGIDFGPMLPIIDQVRHKAEDKRVVIMLRYVIVVYCLLVQLLAGINAGNTEEVTPFTEMFGNALYKWADASRTNVQELKTVDLLKGKKTVAIYFSASW